MQLSPGDGTQPLNPIELRLYTADRTLSVGEFQGPEEPRTTWQAPVDQWFDVVVEMQYGESVPTRLWVYGPDDRQVATLEVALTTSGGRDKANPRQKIGGVTNTSGDVTTYADDWYIAKENLGPLHLGPDGRRWAVRRAGGGGTAFRRPPAARARRTARAPARGRPRCRGTVRAAARFEAIPIAHIGSTVVHPSCQRCPTFVKRSRATSAANSPGRILRGSTRTRMSARRKNIAPKNHQRKRSGP